MAVKTIFLLFSFALALGTPEYAFAADEEDTGNIDVSLMVEGKPRSDTWINVSGGGTLIEIPAAPVLNSLESLLAPEAIRELERKMTTNGTFTNKILARAGITLAIDLPRKRAYLNLVKKGKPAAIPLVAVPNTASAGMAKPPQADSARPSKNKSQNDSGPWTSPTVPALPGSVGDTGKTAAKPSPSGQSPAPPDNPLQADGHWEPVNTDSAGTRTSPPAAAEKPKVELQSYRLDKSRDELFEDVFGHKAPPLPASVEVTLLVDGKSYGTLWILYNYEQKRYTFPVDPVLNALQGLVRRDLWDKLAQRAKLQSRFTVEDLIACGFPTVLNTSVFELSTGVPAQLLGSKMHPLSGQPVDPYSVPVSNPGALSSFINVRARERYSYFQYNPHPSDSLGVGRNQVESRNLQNRQPFLVELEGAVNLKTWVLEGKGTVLENSTMDGVDFRRQDVRLVHDWPRKALRLNVGDLIFPTSGFQSFMNIGGIGLSRDFSLQPHLVAYPVKDFEFFLTNPSEVKVFINGILRATYQLEQGTHDLQGFPLTLGESQIEIQITDNTGQTQTLNFDFIHEPSLLAKGIHVFSFNIGFPSRDVFNVPNLPADPNHVELYNYQYDVRRPALFLDVKRGLTNTVTMEAYSQAVDTGGMVGLGFLHAVRIGKIKLDVAGSVRQDGEFSGAGNIEYTYIPKITSKVSPISWRVRSEYIGEKFYRPGQDASLRGAVNIAGSFQRSSSLFNLNVGASYALRPDSADYYSVYAGLSRNWPKGWSSSLSLKNTFDYARSTNTSVAATINYYFNYEEHSFNASERVENHRPDGSEQGPPPSWDYSTDLLWDYNGSSTFPHNPSLNMATSFGPTSNDFSSRAQWNGNQGIAQIIGRRYEPKAGYIVSNYLDLSLSTSLVFINGNFALARPVQNSFVMVKGVDNEKDCDILVNNNDMGYDAKASRFLPGVVPSISPYYLKKIHLEAIAPPLGSNDERTDFTIYPGYKSGYIFYLGSKSTIIALGTMFIGEGKPAEYQTFQAIPMDGENRDPIAGFTNKVGKFQLTRMRPGKYTIEMYVESKLYTATLILPKKSAGIAPVGVLMLSPK
ncbi:MAG: hypothetical protein ABI036_07055 [Fibrobacteria bacterium]